MPGESTGLLLSAGKMTDYRNVFEQSYWRAIRNVVEGQNFYDAFYERLVGSSDDIRVRFAATDMEFQAKLLNEAIIHLSRFSEHLHSDTYLESVAEHHNINQLDVEPALYAVWLDSMVDTVRAYDRHFDVQTEIAWRVVLSPGLEFMKAHYHPHTG